MVSTQQVWEKHDMNVLSKDGWLGGWLVESSGYDYTKTFYVSKQTPTPRKHDIDHITESTAEDRPNQQF
jgi:hypothetical protein